MDDQDKQQQERIERYLDGQLSAEEMTTFEAQLQKDEELAKAFSLEEAARLIIETSGRAELRNRLDTYESAFEKKASPVRAIRPTWGRWLSFAAAVLVILTLSIWLFFPAATSSEDLFATHFEAYRPPSTVRGESTQSNWENAITAYNANDYVQAATLFSESLQDENTVAYLAQYYLGLSLLAQEPPQPEAALATFEKVLESDHDYRQQTMWYQALALIKLEKTQEARTILESLQKAGNYKKTEVEKLLRELK